MLAAEEARAETQSREADARAERSEAEGEMNALSAETTALASASVQRYLDGKTPKKIIVVQNRIINVVA